MLFFHFHGNLPKDSSLSVMLLLERCDTTGARFVFFSLFLFEVLLLKSVLPKLSPKFGVNLSYKEIQQYQKEYQSAKELGPVILERCVDTYGSIFNWIAERDKQRAEMKLKESERLRLLESYGEREKIFNDKMVELGLPAHFLAFKKDSKSGVVKNQCFWKFLESVCCLLMRKKVDRIF